MFKNVSCGFFDEITTKFNFRKNFLHGTAHLDFSVQATGGFYIFPGTVHEDKD